MSVELLAAIRANPGDDTVRLVFADGLDENAGSEADHARAALIRTQIELHRMSPGDPRRAALTQREKAILDATRI